MKMMRHSQLTNGAGLPATVTIDGVWQVGSYMNMSPVLRIQGRVERQDGTPPYVAVFDEVVAQMHTTRMQPGATLAVFVDPQNPDAHEVGGLFLAHSDLADLARERCPYLAIPLHP